MADEPNQPKPEEKVKEAVKETLQQQEARLQVEAQQILRKKIARVQQVLEEEGLTFQIQHTINFLPKGK